MEDSNVGLIPSRLLGAKEVVAKVMPLTGLLGISRITETNSYVDIGVSIVSAVRPGIKFDQVSSTQGKGFTLSQAIAGAIVEALERYCAANIDQRSLFSGAGNLSPEGDTLGLEFGYGQDFYPSRWIRGVDLYSNLPAWVPALEVAFPYKRCGSDPPYIRPNTSGLAAGGDIVEASLFAMLEVYERHVTSLFYRHVRSANMGAVIDPCSVDDVKSSALLNDLRSKGYELLIFRVTAIFPTYYVAILDTLGLAPKFMIAGTSTALSEEDALNGALLECIQGLVTGLSGGREDLVRSAPKYEKQVYSKTNNFYKIRDLLITQNGLEKFPRQPSKPVSCEWALKRILNSLQDIIKGPCVMCDLSHDTLPLKVVKIVVPDLNDFLVNPGRKTHADFTKV